ncbi:MAG: glycosyltransferase [Rariglobus sp.]|nr:glycosyltransferase [Rariglobus sp.]
MRIGLLTTFLALGDDADSGIGQHYRILADTLTASGHDVHVFYLCKGSKAARARRFLEKQPPPWKIRLITARPSKWISRDLQPTPRIYQLLHVLWQAWAARRIVLSAHRMQPFELIETHSYNLPAFFLLSARRRPFILTRVSTTLRQMVAVSLLQPRMRLWMAAWERNVIRRSDALVTHSGQHRDSVCAVEGFDPERFAIVPHGLPDPGVSSSRAGPEDGGVEFLFVGRFERRKGIDVLLEAIPLVAAACSDARFVLAGSRGDDSEWTAFADRYPALAGSRVHAPGRVAPDELARLYARCSVFVAPSRYESFGMIYAEAMSHGKPVVGCRAGGIPDVVQEGVTGLLAEPGDVASLVDCMIRFARDATLRRRMGQAARQDFLTRYSADILGSSSLRHYQLLLGAG